MLDTKDNWPMTSNPLDNIEDILAGYNWTFNRPNNDELAVKVAGKSCDYHLIFIWQEHMNAIQFCIQFDLNIHTTNAAYVGSAVMHMNENLWIGHFEIPKNANSPFFRYTYLLKDPEHDNHEELENLVDIALTQCERFYPAFHLLSLENAANDKTIPLAVMETQGIS